MSQPLQYIEKQAEKLFYNEQNHAERTEKLLKLFFKKPTKEFYVFFDLNCLLLTASLVNGVICILKKTTQSDCLNFVHTTRRAPS